MTTPKGRRGFNPLTDGLPITITVQQAMDNLATAKERAARRHTPNTTALKPADPATDSPFGGAAVDRSPTRAQREAAEFKASYAVGDTTPSKIDLRKDLPGPMLLKSTEIVRYDHNPRLYANEKRDDIRQSLVANGFQGTLQVTRRHSGEPYMLAAGSNTTLELLQELYAGTGDERYLWVNCIYQPFQSETTLLSQHLGENLNRGDMKFWEVAVAMVELLRLIEEERRQKDPNVGSMAGREASEELAARGLRADKSAISIWRFAVSNLSGLGNATAHLTRLTVRDIFQPRLNSLCALASRFGIDEQKYWAEVVTPALRDASSITPASAEFDAPAICDLVENALAARSAETVETIRQMLSILKLNPKVTLAELRQPSPNLIASGSSGQTSPAAGDGTESDATTITPPSAVAQRPLNLTAAIQAPTDGPSGAQEGARAPRQGAQASPTTSLPPVGTRRSSVGPLFEGGQADTADPLGTLHSAVDELLATAGLSDTLRWHDPMPLGFYLELPDREVHKMRTVKIGSPEDLARTIKTVVWWSLTTISGQWCEGVVDYIDRNSAFYKTYSVEEHDSPLEGTDIEPVQPETADLLIARIAPGVVRPAMQQLRVVEDLVAEVLDQLPERWQLLQKLQLSNSPY